MEANKQICGNKGISFFFLAGLLALFVILSFSSINNVYGSDNETIFGNNDENYSDDDLNNNVNNNTHIIGSPNTASGITVSTSSNGNSVSKLASVDNNYVSKATYISFSYNYSSSSSNFLSLNSYHANYNNKILYDDYGGGNAFYPLNKKDSLEKIGGNSIKVDNMDFNSFFSIFSYNSNYNEYTDSNIYDDNYFINPPLVILISNSNLDFKGTSLERYNNFLNEISNLKFNKIAINEDISVIKSLESRPNLIFSALFFITIFMEHHDNGKEPLNSF